MKVLPKLFSSIPPLFGTLATSISGEIDCSMQTLTSYSNDTGPFIIRPQAVVYPKSSNDIKQVILFAREYGMPITVVGGQTAATGGALSEGILLDLSRHFNRIKHVDMLNQTITIDTGVTVEQLRTKLKSWNMEIPALLDEDPSSQIGGVVGTKSITPSSFHHGSIREWVLGMSVVVDTGEEHKIEDGVTPSGRLLAIYQSVFPFLIANTPALRASKPESSADASGYNLWSTTIGPRQLIDELVGSEGSLAIITEVTLRVAPRKTKSTSIAFSYNDIHTLSKLITLTKSHKAESLFFFDQTFLTLANKHSKSFVLGDKTRAYHLLATFRDTEENNLKERVAHALHQIDSDSCVVTAVDNKTKSTISHDSYTRAILENYSKGQLVSVPLATGVSLPQPYVTNCLQELEDLMANTGKIFCITGYIGSGNISINALFDTRSKEFEDDVVLISKKIYTATKKHKGSPSAKGGDGLLRTPFLSIFYPEQTLEIFSNLKKIWDPKLIFNPSKKTGATISLFIKHLRH